MDNITFCGKDYPILNVYINDYGYRNIAPESLEAKLIQNDRYINKEAQNIDKTIFSFAPDVLFIKGKNETQEKIEHDVRNFVENNLV